MLKIWSMKKEQQKAENADAAAGGKKKVKAAELRTQKDINELSLPDTMKIDFPDPDDIIHFNLEIKPDEGHYLGGRFTFTFDMTNDYPHKPPKIKCDQKIYHPNIDTEGKICLNILRDDWRPVLGINALVVGLQMLFLEPNASDPLNKEAAEDLMDNRDNFQRNVRKTMAGGSIRGVVYDNVMI